MSMAYTNVVKTIFITFLLACFLLLIARESVLRYLAKALIVEVSMETSTGLIPPAVTFCPRYPSTISGWKNSVNVSGWSNFITNSCNKSTAAEVQKCFEENTFELNETILGAVYNLQDRADLQNDSDVKWDVTASNIFYGRCYTFQYSKPILADQLTDGLAFGLNPNISYKVILHDPNFYLIVSNPLVSPVVWREYMSGSGKMDPGKFEWLHISVLEHRLYQDSKKRPCEVSHDYSFNSCVKTALAKLVGCRPPWDIWSPKSIPMCNKVEDMARHEQLDWLHFNSEQKLILETTGCKIPCNYKEYKVEGDPKTGTRTLLSNSSFAFGFNFVSTDITIHREDLVYPTISFISEIGGSLGLFVGFSFLQIWDWMDILISRFKHCIKR